MVLSAHSGFRYLVLLLAVIVIAYAAYGLITKRPYDKNMRILSLALTGVMDLTVLLGLATLFSSRFRTQIGVHVVTMLLATLVAHAVSMVMKRRPVEERTYAPHLIGTAIVLAMVVAGIMSIGRSVIG